MGRIAEDFLLRKEEKTPYWYYRLKGWKSFKSTGQKSKAAVKKVAGGTRDHIRTTLRIIFREAVRERYLQLDPMKYVEPSKIIRKSNEPPISGLRMQEIRAMPRNVAKGQLHFF